MKKILAFASVMSVLALVACGDSTTSKNEACISKIAGTNYICGETAGKDYSDADCNAMSDSTEAAMGLKASALGSCPSGSKANCNVKDDSTGVTSHLYFYGDAGAAVAVFACDTTLGN